MRLGHRRHRALRRRATGPAAAGSRSCRTRARTTRACTPACRRGRSAAPASRRSRPPPTRPRRATSSTWPPCAATAATSSRPPTREFQRYVDAYNRGPRRARRQVADRVLSALAGVLGFPVGHSRSPAMMNAAFGELGIDWRYLRLPVAPELFDETVRALPASGYLGANVTIPHKVAAHDLSDDLTEAAAAIGAVNTLAFARRPHPRRQHRRRRPDRRARPGPRGRPRARAGRGRHRAARRSGRCARRAPTWPSGTAPPSARAELARGVRRAPRDARPSPRACS